MIPGIDLPDWSLDAKCAYMDPGERDPIFFPENPNKVAEARRFCRGEDGRPACPVLEQCLERALEIGQRGSPPDGFWAGTTKSERKLMLKSRDKKCPECGVSVGMLPKARMCPEHRNAGKREWQRRAS